MKRIMILFLVLFVASLTQAQVVNPLPRSVCYDSTFSTHWDSIYVTGKAFQPINVMISHDSGTGTLYWATQNDTTAPYIKTVKQYDAIAFPPTFATWIRIKATAAVHARIWIF